MRLWRLILLELNQRRHEVLAGAVAIALAVATVVAASAIATSSREALRSQVHELGANMLVLPKGAEVSDYYAADFGDDMMPEGYASRLASSELREKVHNVVPRLARRTVIAGEEAILTGVLPKEDLRSHAPWRSANAFRGARETEVHEATDHCSSREAPPAPGATPARPAQPTPSIHRARVVSSLGRHEARLGSDFAERAGLSVGDSLAVEGRTFTVTEVGTPTGTVDDLRVFVHLERAQEILDVGRVVNVLEVVGCGCHLDLVALGKDLERILPGTQVVTVRTIADTQWNAVALMGRFATALTGILLALAAASMVNSLTANVVERRREIGVLVAVGAAPRTVQWLFVLRAAAVGAVGGAGGFGVGIAAGRLLGGHFGGVVALPRLEWLPVAVAGASLFAAVTALVPAARAAAVDPSQVLEEV